MLPSTISFLRDIGQPISEEFPFTALVVKLREGYFAEYQNVSGSYVAVVARTPLFSVGGKERGIVASAWTDTEYGSTLGYSRSPDGIVLYRNPEHARLYGTLGSLGHEGVPIWVLPGSRGALEFGSQRRGTRGELLQVITYVQPSANFRVLKESNLPDSHSLRKISKRYGHWIRTLLTAAYEEIASWGGERIVYPDFRERPAQTKILLALASELGWLTCDGKKENVLVVSCDSGRS